MKSGDLPLCGWCDEPVADDEIAQWIPHLEQLGAAVSKPYHRECLVRSVSGGLNHLMGSCTCCGGALPPDPPGLSKRDAARAACHYFVAREEAISKIAREVCHEFGMPWTDPRTGKTYPPPAK